MVPVLFKPAVCAVRNRWRKSDNLRLVLGRDILLAGITLLLVLATYQGTLATLASLQSQNEAVYIAPTVPLSLMLLFLTGLLFFSGSISALSSLFLGRDLELILASPIRMPTFFLGKFLDVLTSCSWMVIVFGAPMLLAFGVFYNSPISFYRARQLCCYLSCQWKTNDHRAVFGRAREEFGCF